MNLRRSLTAFGFVPTIIGCGLSSIDTGGTADAEESDAAISARKVRIDPNSLAVDGTTRLIDYQRPSSNAAGAITYVGLALHAKAGDVIDIDAEGRSDEALPALWFTDDKFRTIARSNDSSTRAHLRVIIPANGKAFVLLRDHNFRSGSFAIWATGEIRRPGGPQLCGSHRWQEPVPADGDGMMAYGDTTWLFARDGKTWTMVKDGEAVIEAIPLPDGALAMQSVHAEIAPSGRPLVTFSDRNERYAAFFDGKRFVKTVAIGEEGYAAHADTKERIYTLDGYDRRLAEYDGGKMLVRGALPVREESGFAVTPDGTVLELYSRPRPPPNSWTEAHGNDLVMATLPHGTLTWTEKVIASLEWGHFSSVQFTAAPDGSLHIAHTTGYLRSRNGGLTWDEGTFRGGSTKAKLIDEASPAWEQDPATVGGDLVRLAAQDYEHASLTLQYASGSMGVSGAFVLRRCTPLLGTQQTDWPAERFAYAGLAGVDVVVAVNERGMVSILTPSGVRQDVSSP